VLQRRSASTEMRRQTYLPVQRCSASTEMRRQTYHCKSWATGSGWCPAVRTCPWHLSVCVSQGADEPLDAFFAWVRKKVDEGHILFSVKSDPDNTTRFRGGSGGELAAAQAEWDAARVASSPQARAAGWTDGTSF
jgi:hypothetical protein